MSCSKGRGLAAHGLHRIYIVAVFAFAAALLGGCGADGTGNGGGGEQGASDYPTEDIELMVPYSPGGGYDSYARTLAPFLEEHLPNDVSVVVRNEPAGGGQAAANQLYAAEPDGTLIELMDLLGVVGASLTSDPDFQIEEFTYLGTIDVDPRILVVAGDSEINSMEDLQNQPGPINATTGGFTTSTGIATAVVFDTLGIEYTPILSEGNTENRLAVVRGDAVTTVSAIDSALGELETGDLKPILYMGEPLEEGSIGYDEVQGVETADELGYPELNSLQAPRVLAATPGLPEDTRQTLTEAVQAALNDPEFQAKAEEGQLTVNIRSAEETEELVNETLTSISEYEDVLTQAIEKEGS